MRLYRSRLAGEAFYPAVCVGDITGTMLASGWIEPVGAGYRLTKAGIRYWAGMTAHLMTLNSCNSANFNELRHILGKPFTRAKLNKEHIKMLKALVEADGSLPLERLGRIYNSRYTNGIQKLMNEVYIVSDGHTVTLTDVGWLVVRERGLAQTEEAV